MIKYFCDVCGEEVADLSVTEPFLGLSTDHLQIDVKVFDDKLICDSCLLLDIREALREYELSCGVIKEEA